MRGGRDAPPAATAPQPPDPQLVAVDTAWRLMVRRVPKHARCIFSCYIQRCPPKVICRRIHIHWREFPKFMGHSRSMVVNILKELGL